LLLSSPSHCPPPIIPLHFPLVQLTVISSVSASYLEPVHSPRGRRLPFGRSYVRILASSLDPVHSPRGRRLPSGRSYVRILARGSFTRRIISLFSSVFQEIGAKSRRNKHPGFREHTCRPVTHQSDRLCGLVVRLPGLQTQRSRVRLKAVPDFLSSNGSGTGSTQPL
jgi:hypothetical protein